MPTPRISIVLNTHNRLPQLQQAVASLRALRYPAEDFELIIVDDASSDGTAEWLQALAARPDGLPVRLCLLPEHVGLSRGRNAGIAVARGIYIITTDDDCLYDPDWLRELHAEIEKHPCGGIGGRIICSGSDTIVSRFSTYLGYNSQANHGETVLKHVNTANAIFPARVLREMGGFDESYHRVGATDYELSQRLLRHGYALRACPLAIVYHSNKTSCRVIHRAKYRQGYGIAHCRVREYPRRSYRFVGENLVKLGWNFVRLVIETPLRIPYDTLVKRRPLFDAAAFAVLERTTKICDLWGRIVGGVVYGFTSHPPVMVGGAWTREGAEGGPKILLPEATISEDML